MILMRKLTNFNTDSTKNRQGNGIKPIGPRAQRIPRWRYLLSAVKNIQHTACFTVCHQLPSLPEHLSPPPPRLFIGVRVCCPIFSFVCSFLWAIVCPFCHCVFVFAVSDDPFIIFKLFLFWSSKKITHFCGCLLLIDIISARSISLDFFLPKSSGLRLTASTITQQVVCQLRAFIDDVFVLSMFILSFIFVIVCDFVFLRDETLQVFELLCSQLHYRWDLQLSSD